PDGLHENAGALDDALALLQHEPVVGGDVRLALGGVDDEGAHLPEARADLHMGGEAGAAHTGETGLADDVHDLPGGTRLIVGMGRELRAEGVLEVIFNDHRVHHAAAAVGTGLNGHDLAGDAGMDGGAQPGGSGNLLPHRDLVAHLYDWRAGRADVHGHG